MSDFRRGVAIAAVRLALLVGILCAWEFLPRIGWLQDRSVFFDPFFISSPSRIGDRMVDFATGRNDTPLVWPYARRTLSAALVGTSIGLLAGLLAGLVFSASVLVNQVVRPFIVAINAIPRIALIPIIVTLFGVSFRGSVVSVIMVVFFVTFFNAYEGGASVQQHVIDNAHLLGATRWQVTRHIRLQYALAWTLAALPLAVTFGIISSVTVEILTGYPGMGRLLSLATATASASTTFATVAYLSVIGVALTAIAEGIKRRRLHWWGK